MGDAQCRCQTLSDDAHQDDCDAAKPDYSHSLNTAVSPECAVETNSASKSEASPNTQSSAEELGVSEFTESGIMGCGASADKAPPAAGAPAANPAGASTAPPGQLSGPPANQKAAAPKSVPKATSGQGLESDDLESVRKALAAVYSRGAGSANVPANVAAAEARLRSERGLPEDWDLRAYCGGQLLEGGTGGRQASGVIAYQLQPASVNQAVQSLFDGTYRKVYTRDRRGAPIPDKFVVKDVHRVMNDQVWREYTDRKNKIRERCGSSKPTVPDGALTMNHITEKRLSALPSLDSSVNEVWLFHGTTKEASTGIAENDFRLDFSGSNAGTLYGKGIYLAENASKSDEYGEGPKGPANKEMERGFEAPRPPPGPPPPLVRESYILVCRSALGQVNYTDERQPDPDALQKSCLEGRYDSVLGDRLKTNGTFRETVVYNDDNVYPEYIVRYERIFFHERFAEVYEAMLKRKQAGRFKGPTKDELEVLKSLWNIFGMPNKGKINKWQLLDLLISICQPPLNEGPDLDATFQEWDTKKDGVIDWDEFLQEVIQRVNDSIGCSGPAKFADIYSDMLNRQKAGKFRGVTSDEEYVLKTMWYQYAKNGRNIDKWQLLELLKAINQPPANERGDLDETFQEIDTKRDGVIDYDEYIQEIQQRVKDGIGA